MFLSKFIQKSLHCGLFFAHSDFGKELKVIFSLPVTRTRTKAPKLFGPTTLGKEVLYEPNNSSRKAVYPRHSIFQHSPHVKERQVC